MRPVTLRAIVVAVAVVVLTGGSVPAGEKGVAIELIRRECSACHGARGISVAPTFPHLAGQHAAYIEAQLKAFRDRSRSDPKAQAFMWGMAAQLSDGTIADIAAYYAAQPPPPGGMAQPADVGAGRKIYEEGIEAQHVPPCQSCHMKHGEGAAVFPRLAGQHKGYLEQQLEYFASGLRTDPTMRESAKNLTARQIAQIAAFLGTREQGAAQARDLRPPAGKFRAHRDTRDDDCRATPRGAVDVAGTPGSAIGSFLLWTLLLKPS